MEWCVFVFLFIRACDIVFVKLGFIRIVSVSDLLGWSIAAANDLKGCYYDLKSWLLHWALFMTVIAFWS
jgi:hypothetical protein